MNVGERNELIFKIILVHKRDNRLRLFNQPITSVGFMNKEYSRLPHNFNINSLTTMSDNELNDFTESIGIGKAPAGAKADVYINRIGVSLKSLEAAPAALVNHTKRPGFEFACQQKHININELDSIIDEYWSKRQNGLIKEDTRTTDPNCPFVSHRDYLRPLLEYFLFEGTGTKLSIAPAEYIIEFSNPFDETKYRKLNKFEAVNNIWSKLIFSLRATKGMPKNYNINTYTGKNAESIARWVRYCNNKYRGALHIRTSK